MEKLYKYYPQPAILSVSSNISVSFLIVLEKLHRYDMDIDVLVAEQILTG